MSLVVLLVSKGHYETTLTRTELKCANFPLFGEMGEHEGAAGECFKNLFANNYYNCRYIFNSFNSVFESPRICGSVNKVLCIYLQN